MTSASLVHDHIVMIAPMHIDYEPLLGMGFHQFKMEDVQRICVDAFPQSTSRPQIMAGLMQFIQKLVDSGISGELWLDGSFFTHKINPKDVDIVLRISASILDDGSEEIQNIIKWVNKNQKHTLFCDSYTLMDYPLGDPLRVEFDWWYSYWHARRGFSREGDPKGIAVLSLSGVVS